MRSDGITVSAVEHYVDGIFGPDPVSVQFRLPDGTVIAQAEQARDGVVVRSSAIGLEVYRFPTDWIPVASSVVQFDGLSLTDITTAHRRWLSPLVHTRAHLRAYAVILGMVAILTAFWFAVVAIPRDESQSASRLFRFVGVGSVTGICSQRKSRRWSKSNPAVS